MREIKLRAWDKVDSKIRKVTGWNISATGIRSTYSMLSGKVRNATNVEIMQYTGLKDKNDTEIYEGDIISTWYDQNEVIEWGVGGWLPFINTIEWPDYWYDNKPNVEVIGNIYENPELL